MKKSLPLILSLCCIGANATSANYDLLGRKSSKMNSPMVYKNVDYSKVKSNEEQTIGSSLENRALAKTGMPDNVKAIQGAFFTNRSVDAWVGTSHTLEDGHFFLKKYNTIIRQNRNFVNHFIQEKTKYHKDTPLIQLS